MLKTVKTILSQDREHYTIPRRVQDVIPISCIWEDGIFKVGNKFAKSFKFSDINYMVASRDDKSSIILTYCELLNSLDSGATAKITVNKHNMNEFDLELTSLIPLQGDWRDAFREEYNSIILDKPAKEEGTVQERYFTISVAKRNIAEARTYFARVGADLQAHFAALGSKCTELSTDERLRILHDFYRAGEENSFRFDARDMMKKGHDFRDYICPDNIEKYADHLKIGERYARVIYLKDYASYIKDSMVSELTELSRNMMFSIDIIPIPTDEAVREVENRLLGVETNITNWQRRQNSNNNFSAVIPYDMEQQRRVSKEFLDDLTTRDQRMMFVVMTMVHTADTKERLDSDTEAILATARKHMCQMAPLKYQQLDGLNTVLPIGVRKINAFRTLTTESLAVFMPFKVQEIMDKGGIYYGQNAISNNMILCNKENLLNQSAFLLGVPGSGKSFCAKGIMVPTMLNSDDDILICDPEGEYAPMVEALMGDECSVIRVAAGGKDRLNAMYMVDGYGENDPIIVKSQFIMSLIEQIDSKGIGPQQKSIIDRCTRAVYRDAEKSGITPTLSTLRNKLLEQPEPEAKQIALSMELFTTGSLDIFGQHSTVDLDKRVIVFDIHGLGAQLKPTGLLVITDTILNRVTLNWKRGKRTHVFIDEFHVVFENEFSASFFNSAWRQFRKRNAYPTAITQNVEYLLDSVQASTMLSNSEFVVMLNQAAHDREKLAKLLNISSEQLSYITNSDAGCGLIKYGSALVPFVNRFPRDTRLYSLMTTRPGEGKFSGQA
ncbi:MAG: ATP-binding protein [Clostridia bacterium]|nr:ATP-binding protein [Clostridia bacterium]